MKERQRSVCVCVFANKIILHESAYIPFLRHSNDVKFSFDLTFDMLLVEVIKCFFHFSLNIVNVFFFANIIFFLCALAIAGWLVCTACYAVLTNSIHTLFTSVYSFRSFVRSFLFPFFIRSPLSDTNIKIVVSSE